MKKLTILLTGITLMTSISTMGKTIIGKNNIQVTNKRMTPETLWAMGRIGDHQASPDGKKVVYQTGYYSVKENKGHQVLFVMNSDGKEKIQITDTEDNETSPTWIKNGQQIAFLRNGQIWTYDLKSKTKKQWSQSKQDIEGYIFSPNEEYVILIKSIKFNHVIEDKPQDLPKTTGRVINDLMYRHWDHYVESIQHPFLAQIHNGQITDGEDLLKDEPYECPMEPFGGTEQLAWSPDSKQIAYTCRKKSGKAYAISTDSDIFLYDIIDKSTINLCKPADFKPIEVDGETSLENQEVNKQKGDFNMGYDTNPKFSPDGKYLAWQSMERDGYEADINRLCLYDLKQKTKRYLAKDFESNVDNFCWDNNSKNIYFTGCWHACINVYMTPLSDKSIKITDGWYDYGNVQMLGNTGLLLTNRHSLSAPDDLYIVNPKKSNKKNNQANVTQITFENKHILDQLELGKVEQRWVKTTDGKKELVWIVLPSGFDATKKYPAILFCEGGPQSPVSQFWSYRWNFQIMAANGYVIIAPNRRGLPGFGKAWNEQVSGDWTGQCMHDYLSAVDDAVQNLPYIDKDKLGCVGASFGGFSVYYLAGHHDKRFKAFISHDGAFNLESMYTDTEETFFSNWEYESAYWKGKKGSKAQKTYDNSPHRFVDRWDTPILCIHGEKDYRICYNQGMGAFNAARIKGIPAQLLLFPDENHWVLKPQNGILWQRTFFNWLDKWLKK